MSTPAPRKPAFRADRRRVNGAIAAVTLGAALPAAAQAPEPAAPSRPKVLRYAFRVAESSLDPAKINDIYSRTLTPHIYEALYKYDPLARPIKIRPLTTAAMPEVSEDFRTWTMRVRPGIYFMSDPAFNGQRRELVAQDYVYTLKRFADPANRSPSHASQKEQTGRDPQRCDHLPKWHSEWTLAGRHRYT